MINSVEKVGGYGSGTNNIENLNHCKEEDNDGFQLDSFLFKESLHFL